MSAVVAPAKVGILPERAASTIGLVVPDIANEFFAELARAVVWVARRSGRTVLVADSETDLETERDLLRTFVRRQIDGVILVSQEPDQAQAMLTAADTHGIFLGTAPRLKPASSIAVDNVGGAWMATHHLVDHGHETVAMISGPAGDAVADARREGWQRALDERGLGGRHLEQPFTVDGGYVAGADLLGTADRPRAVFAASDRQAIGLLRGAADLGICVPDDLAVVAFDGSAASAYEVPALTTIRQPITEMAELAISLLLGSDHTPVTTVLDVGLELRRSCGCTPDR